MSIIPRRRIVNERCLNTTLIATSESHKPTKMKIGLIGDYRVGKTAIIESFRNEGGFPEIYTPTIGVKESELTTSSRLGDNVPLQLFDFSGNDKYWNPSAHAKLLKQMSGIIVVFDVTNRPSFSNVVRKYIPDLIRASLSNDQWQCILLVGNKCDCEANEVSSPRSSKGYNNYLDLEIGQREHHQLAKELGISLVARVSAKTGEGIHRMFNGLIASTMRQYELRARIERSIGGKDRTKGRIKSKSNGNTHSYDGDDETEGGCGFLPISLTLCLSSFTGDQGGTWKDVSGADRDSDEKEIMLAALQTQQIQIQEAKSPKQKQRRGNQDCGYGRQSGSQLGSVAASTGHHCRPIGRIHSGGTMAKDVTAPDTATCVIA